MAAGGTVGTGGSRSAAGGAVGSGGPLGDGGALGVGGSTTSADDAASTSDLDTCSSDADCASSCIWVTAPTNSSQCTATYCCGVPLITNKRCDANRAAWASYCPSQSPTREICPCLQLCPNEVFGCFGGRCATSCPPAADAAPDVAFVASGGAPGSGGAGGMGGANAGSGGLPGNGGAAGTPVQAPVDCSSSILNVFPRDNTIPGWTVDRNNATTVGRVAATATSELEAESLIDGAAVAFFATPNTPLAFAWQTYVNTTLTDAPGPDYATVSLYVLQMANTQQAFALYTSLLTAPLYSGRTWMEPSSPLIGSDSRLADTGDRWWINFYKDNCYVEVSLSPSYGPAPDYTPGDATTKAAAVTFSQAVASKM